ncbi:MAG: leucine-rich repeat protein [Bacteroidales bacterium]|nr:leucine-rich repeat protein [Bacteroidales bacterium]
MALFKCKMCGGDLEIVEGASIAECEYCGTKQTVPKAIDENLQNLFNRANTLRIKSEFDKAEKLYEKLIQADSTQAEAYWGLILCKYGIEYVDDPATFKKVPTCHRASFESIVADEDYKSALKNADMSQRAIYEEQAKEIDRIQKDILALAQKEENYDVFICYKETDADGRRTQDSVIANDIYYQLTQEGFKVFYAAITLEGKLGSAYEPIIFAALNSAKVMLVIGTKPEYFNAVWVKNEWSRYLKIIKKDRSKLLIPCYRDMDAYELPEEFAHLQAQDMSKIGFINDVVRGIKKVLKKDEPKPTVVKETVVNTFANPNTAPLLKRSFMFLEDGDFAKADEFFEKVLNQDPENAQAYLGKLMAELHVRKQEQLKDCAAPFDNSSNYQKALRFADDALKADLVGYIEYINARNENARLTNIYSQATKTMRSANNEEAYKKAAYLFRSISEYKDSDKLAEKCLENAEIARKDAILSKAQIELHKNTIDGCDKAIALLDSIPGWKDVDEQKEASIARKAELEELYRIRNERDAKFKKKITIITSIALAAVVLISILITAVIIPLADYNRAMGLINAGEDSSAYELLIKHPNFKDAETQIANIKQRAIAQAEAHAQKGEYYEAHICLLSVGCTTQDYPLMEAYYCAGQYQYGRAVALGLTDLVIADGITSISDSAFKDLKGFKNITIPSSVTSIGVFAFSGCSSLTSFTIPGSVTSIGNSAFSGCTSLTSITIPDSVTSIGARAFYECGNLTSVHITDMAKWCKISFYDSYSNPLYYANHLYLNGNLITELLIPNSVTSIGAFAFSGCSSLTSITIPDSITSLGSGAFQNCDNLTSITFEGTIEEWKTIAKEKDWDDSTEAYTVYCMDGTISKSGNIKLSGLEYTLNADKKSYSVTSIGGIKDTSFTIPATFNELPVTAIGDEAFSNCKNLTSITIGKNIKDIGKNAFGGCSSLTSILVDEDNPYYSSKQGVLYNKLVTTLIYLPARVSGTWTLPSSVTTFGDYAFYKFPISDIAIPNCIKKIGSYTFYGCTNLTSVTLSSSVTNIGTYAFYGCSKLTSIHFDGTKSQWKAITKGANWNTGTDNIVVYCKDGNICTTHKEVIDKSAVAPTCTQTGLTASKKCEVCGTILTSQRTVPALGHSYQMQVTKKPTATANGQKTFTCSTCGDSYTEAIVPVDFTVTSSNRSLIGYKGVTNENLVIPDVFENNGTWYKVVAIDRSAFSECTSLKSVIIPGSVKTIGKWAFSQCSNLVSVTIQNGVTSIDELAFLSCKKLTSLTIPSSITYVGSFIVEGCKALTSITYGGTVEQWNAASGLLNVIYSGFGDHIEIVCSNGTLTVI